MSDEPTPRHVPCQCPECVGMADRIAELEAEVVTLRADLNIYGPEAGDRMVDRIAELEAELEVEQMERSQAELEADEARARIAELEADKERLLAEVARHWHCTCLPYAEPDDGECGRCRFLRLGGSDE